MILLFERSGADIVVMISIDIDTLSLNRGPCLTASIGC